MRPPPGGDPYLDTTEGGAMRLYLPKIKPFIVKGILSSSTQTYSGSLGTSPKRGFLMRSHRVSVGRIATLGSFCFGKPMSSRKLKSPQPEHTSPTAQTLTMKRTDWHLFTAHDTPWR